MRVIIIGAGLGGLTLAHGLRAAGIEVAVHERGPRDGVPPASYGIHVDHHGNEALHACLPAENWSAYDRDTVPAPAVVRFRDSTLAPLTELRLSTPAQDADPVTHRRAVRRHALHTALTRGLEGTIRWGSDFERYTPEPDGRVRALFTDGTDDVGDVLVGADGSNSRVRAQYQPHLVRRDLGILTIAGRIPLGHPCALALPEDVADGSVNNVVPPGPGWLFASTWPDADTGRNRPTEPPTRDGDLVWAYALDRNAYPDDADECDPALVRDGVARRTTAWDPRVTALIEATDPGTIGRIPLRSMTTLPFWRPSPVTLLGDAIHTMTPMAGVGANTALRDADALRCALTTPGTTGSVDRIGRYETEMRRYANTALATSTRNARNAATDKRLPRAAFRALLRVAEALPPVKRAVFPAPVHTTAPSVAGERA